MTTQGLWTTFGAQHEEEDDEESTLLLCRVCPDRSRSFSRPLPPPSECFAKLKLTDDSDSDLHFFRICPDRSRSSSQPLPPPMVCFSKVRPIDCIMGNNDKEEKATIDKEGDDETYLTEDCSLSDGDSLQSTPHNSPQSTAPTSVKCMQATQQRRKHSLVATTLFGSFREGDIQEVSLDLSVQ